MKIAIFHGTMGAPQGNWFPWLAQELKLRGHEVYVPKLPTPEGQSLQNWLAAAQQQISDLEKVDVLVGHSCGASFIPHLVVALNLSPKLCVMVSPFSGPLGFPDYDALNQTFFLKENKLCKIESFLEGEHKTGETGEKAILGRTGAFRLVILHGDNDPYVPLDQACWIADKTKGELVIIPGGGHLNAEFGYTTFPALLPYIDHVTV